MAMDAIQPVYRETAPNTIHQVSLTKRDRELQTQEGQPPLEVASTEQQVLRWQQAKTAPERWWRVRKRAASQEDEAESSSGEEQAEAPSGPRLAAAEEHTEDDTGTLFDDRS